MSIVSRLHCRGKTTWASSLNGIRIQIVVRSNYILLFAVFRFRLFSQSEIYIPTGKNRKKSTPAPTPRFGPHLTKAYSCMTRIANEVTKQLFMVPLAQIICGLRACVKYWAYGEVGVRVMLSCSLCLCILTGNSNGLLDFCTRCPYPSSVSTLVDKALLWMCKFRWGNHTAWEHHEL